MSFMIYAPTTVAVDAFPTRAKASGIQLVTGSLRPEWRGRKDATESAPASLARRNAPYPARLTSASCLLYTYDMNRLSTATRAHLIDLLVEGMSLRSVERVTGISIKTITKLLVAAGEACAAYHDEHVRDLRLTRRLQADEIWSFTYAKEKNVKTAKAAPPEAGDTWTWLAMDADHKLVISWAIGPRDLGTAYGLMVDLAERLVNRVQMTTDGAGLIRAGGRGRVRCGRRLRAAHQAVRQGEGHGRGDHGSAVQPAHVPRNAGPARDRATGPEAHRDQLHRAAEPHAADVEPAVYEAHQRVLEEAREPRGARRAALHALQLLPDPQDAEDDASDGGRRDRDAAGLGVDRRPDRRASAAAAEAGTGERARSTGRGSRRPRASGDREAVRHRR